jgi:hypothetical protein
LNSVELSKILLLEEMIARVMKIQVKTNLRNRLRTVGIPAGMIADELFNLLLFFSLMIVLLNMNCVLIFRKSLLR